jgi:hypothetical protein
MIIALTRLWSDLEYKKPMDKKIIQQFNEKLLWGNYKFDGFIITQNNAL